MKGPAGRPGKRQGGGNPNNPYVRGILLDGGGSTQLIGSAVSLSSTRPVPQIVAPADKSQGDSAGQGAGKAQAGRASE